MNADRRIVPEKHLSYLLEEDRILERTQKVKHSLGHSHKRIDRVADKWIEWTGINSLARVILKNVDSIPVIARHTVANIHSHPSPVQDTHVSHLAVTHASHHTAADSLPVTKTEIHHGHDTHTAHSTHTEHVTHGHHNEQHAEHHADSHEHHVGHGGNHDDHGHHGGGHEHWSHHGGHFSTFVSSGHWCGGQWARIFAMIGRIFGEIIGYIIKALILAVLFWPTRTTILVFLISTFLNTTMNTSLPVWIAAGIAGIIHLIFTGIDKINGGWWGHGESHWGGWHGHH